MRRRSDFNTPPHNNEYWYDLVYDKDLIEASFAMQYAIRLRREADITLGEFYRLLQGLMPDTPLGRTVAIRSEKDPARLKRFTPHERKIRAQWQRMQRASVGRAEQGQAQTQDWEAQIKALQHMLASVF